MRLRSLAALLVVGCGVPEPSTETAGYSPDGGRVGGDATAACGRGFMVIGTGADYASSNVALVDRHGGVLSESFASSATSDVGLGPMLSGDVVAPTMPQRGAEVVLIDRQPASRLVWFDLATAEETGRLDVGTGFASNPHDYAEVAPDKAYVTRFDESPDPAAEPGRAGGDLLVVNPIDKTITGHVEIRSVIAGEPEATQPRPERIVIAEGRAVLLLAPTSASFGVWADARLVEIDPETDAIGDVLLLEGLAGCSGMALSPDGSRVAVGCTPFDGDGDPDPSRSGIAVVDVRGGLSEERRFMSAAFDGRPTGFYVEFASPEMLVTTSFGELGAAAMPDRLLSIDLRSGTVQELLSRDEAFSLGEARCACGSCVAADASVPGGQLVPLRASEGAVTASAPVVVERRYSLLPRYVGRF